MHVGERQGKGSDESQQSQQLTEARSRSSRSIEHCSKVFGNALQVLRVEKSKTSVITGALVHTLLKGCYVYHRSGWFQQK